MDHEIEIDGYTVILDTDMDGDGDDNSDRVSGCWINYQQFSGSLEHLRATGELWDGDGCEHKVAQETIDDIGEWAEENGYYAQLHLQGPALARLARRRALPAIR